MRNERYLLGIYFPGPMIKAQHYPLVVSHHLSPPNIATHENQSEPGNTEHRARVGENIVIRPRCFGSCYAAAQSEGNV